MRDPQTEIDIGPAGSAPNMPGIVGLPVFELPRLFSDLKVSMRAYITTVEDILTLMMNVLSPKVANGTGTRVVVEHIFESM